MLIGCPVLERTSLQKEPLGLTLFLSITAILIGMCTNFVLHKLINIFVLPDIAACTAFEPSLAQ